MVILPQWEDEEFSYSNIFIGWWGYLRSSNFDHLNHFQSKKQHFVNTTAKMKFLLGYKHENCYTVGGEFTFGGGGGESTMGGIFPSGGD